MAEPDLGVLPFAGSTIETDEPLPEITRLVSINLLFDFSSCWLWIISFPILTGSPTKAARRPASLVTRSASLTMAVTRTS